MRTPVLLLAALLVAASTGAQSSATSLLTFDASKIRVATDTFEVALSQDGQRMRVGTEILELRKDGVRFVLTERISAAALGMEGTITLSFGANLEPINRTDRGTFQGSAFQGTVAVADGRIAGSLQSPGATGIQTVPVDAAASADVLLEGDALGILLATANLAEGVRGTRSVLDDETGKLETVSISVEGVETIEVPAGRFEVFRVRAQGKDATVFYISTAAPRRLVRLTMSNAPIELRLMKK